MIPGVLFKLNSSKKYYYSNFQELLLPLSTPSKISVHQSKNTFCMHTRTTRRQFRLQRQAFSIWRPSWRPYWISRLAIIYASLCRQFQKLQAIGNILIYDTSCCTGGSGLPLERVASFTHCHPTFACYFYFNQTSFRFLFFLYFFCKY